jgi:hypothetical protein
MGAALTPIDHSAADATALRLFALDLRRVRRAAGEPPYATLVQRMNGQFSKATISRVLNGGRPSWRFTHCFLRACGVSDSAIIETWRPKWTALQNSLRPLDLQDSPSGAECTICGVWAANTSRHADYHRQRGDLATSCAGTQPHPPRLRNRARLSDGPRRVRRL